uniref:ZM domain-containing protein n=1 Tax=Rhabditophanes sp. KR3021 TaxID=114890 RepID=A0AC35TG18_9BILA
MNRPSHSQKHFEDLGTEESHVIESFERRVHGGDAEPQHSYSTNQYTERKTFGRDENGEIIVKIETNPKDPVRPVTPVSPVYLSDGKDQNEQERLMKPLPPLESLYIDHIPRIDPKKSLRSPRTFSNQNSPRSGISFSNSPHSRRSSAAGLPINTLSPRSVAPLNASPSALSPTIRKTTLKRLVNIIDGKPLTDYKETVTYEPNPNYLAALPMTSPHSMISPTTNLRERGFSNDNYSKEYYNAPSPLYSPRPHSTTHSRRESKDNEAAYVMQNPLYSEDY